MCQTVLRWGPCLTASADISLPLISLTLGVSSSPWPLPDHFSLFPGSSESVLRNRRRELISFFLSTFPSLCCLRRSLSTLSPPGSLRGWGPSLLHMPRSEGFEQCVRSEVHMHSLTYSRQCVGLWENWWRTGRQWSLDTWLSLKDIKTPGGTWEEGAARPFCLCGTGRLLPPTWVAGLVLSVCSHSPLFPPQTNYNHSFCDLCFDFFFFFFWFLPFNSYCAA